jgi:putative peptidoglycan lipid II flippase
VAYQVAWVFFLAPYAILAQPILTTILPELVSEARDADRARFAASIRWSLERMGLFVLPVSALLVALALPAMRAVSFGEVGPEGPGLLAAGLAGLGVGLLPYGAFLLLARALYALGDSRTPGLTAVAVAVVGAGVMAVGAATADGAARVGVLGVAHSTAYLLGCLALTAALRRRIGSPVWPSTVGVMAALAGGVGLAAWWGSGIVLGDESSRSEDVAVVVVTSLVALGVTLLAHRALGLRSQLAHRAAAPAAPVPGGDVPEVLA